MEERGPCVCEEAPVQIMTGYHCAPDSVNLRALHTGSLLNGLHMNCYGLWRLSAMPIVHMSCLHVKTEAHFLIYFNFLLLKLISFFTSIMIFSSGTYLPPILLYELKAYLRNFYE